MKRTYQSIADRLLAGTPVLVDVPEGRVTANGLYRFLRLIAEALHPELENEPDWRRIYLVHMAVQRLARQARVKVPFEQTVVERRRVKALLIDVPRSEALRGRAFQWARR